jgi:hypothetical protein
MSFLGAQNSIALGVQGLIHIDTGGGAGGSADYLLAKSLRFRSSASAYLDRTPAVAGNQKTWTWSGWVKRGTLGSAQAIFAEAVIGYATYFTLFFESDNTIGFDGDFAGTRVSRKTASVFRDPSAWYHVVLVLDTTQATDTNRVLMYVNGVINSFSTVINGTWPAQNNNGGVNAAQTHNIGRRPIDNDRYCDLDLAEINFVDGQALAPTAFGAYSIYNQWLPIKYAGTYGTNGFYLPFTNTTSTSTLVADSSGNANNWTPNNISLTAGSTYDSLTDVPTLTSTTVANYAVLNPLDSGRTLSNGNLTYAAAASGITKATIGVSTGKWYWEFTAGNTECIVGLCAITLPSTTAWIGSSSGGWGYFGQTGNKYVGGAGATYGLSYTTNDVIGVAFDATNGTLTFYKNGASQGTAFTGITGSVYCPANGNNVLNDSGSLNFGQQPFVYTAPSGFLPLNTFNI